jgi:plasmid stabilization system protein ParE
MGYKLTISESANQDLDEILEYISIKLADPKAASDFVDELDKRYDTLEEHPYMYETSRNKRLREKGYHMFPVKNYIVLYLIDEIHLKVIISRIFYGGQNYERYL